MSANWPKTLAALRLLRDCCPIPAEDEYLGFCDRYQQLCSTWNPAAKLLSKIDIENRFDAHISDSLSLLPYVRAAISAGVQEYVDIGPGAGFPAVPILAAGIEVQTRLIERSAKKCEFLGLAVARLGLAAVSLVQAEYPHYAATSSPKVYTARATDNPDTLDERLMERLLDTDLYLAQRAVNVTRSGLSSFKIQDAFDRHSLRRSELYVVSQTTMIERFHVEPVLLPFR